VFCLLENHNVGARLAKIMIPECDRRVSLHPALPASTKHDIETSLPLGWGMLVGIASAALGRTRTSRILRIAYRQVCKDMECLFMSV
jgi:hypothetical protein